MALGLLLIIKFGKEVTTMTKLSAITLDSTIAKYVTDSLDRIRRHPFIRNSSVGNLSEDQAKRWIMCAGRESRSFPDILQNLISWSSNERIKIILRRNLADEEGHGVPEHAHFMHYLQLLDKIGVSRDEFYTYSERVGIKLAVSLGYNISALRNEAPAIGYMLVNESMTSITYAAAKSAITIYYPELKTEFFDIHVDVDERHVDELYEAVYELDSSQIDDLLFGIDIGERGMAVLLDEAYGIFEHYEVIPAYTTDI
ncbi:iron-containing redox enzyme family protein [Microcoleus sp. N9_A2]|uniref:iron-containing redox enzyme family protein n=2 Tax=Microcoleus TaxID=44471 RepID=UPI002FD3127D